MIWRYVFPSAVCRFVTRGRGVSIHRTDCINIINLPEMERVRLIDAEWEDNAKDAVDEKYIAEIKIYAMNRNGLLADITKILTEKNISIRSLNTRVNKQGYATLAIAFEINSREQLNTLVDFHVLTEEQLNGILSQINQA